MMEQAGFEGLSAHKEEHRRFVEKLNAVDISQLDEDQQSSLWIF